MDRPMPNMAFRFMSFFLGCRDLFIPPQTKLSGISIKPGHQILDFGCGPGAYSLKAAEMVGAKGKIYAMDIHPLAIKRVQTKAAHRGVQNIETIQSARDTGLAGGSIDIIFLFGVYHSLKNPEWVLEEFYRIIKKSGTLSVIDPHIKENELIAGITQSAQFKLMQTVKKVHLFGVV